MKRLKTLSILPAVLLLLACAPSLIPVSVPGGIADVESRSLTLTKEGVSITVYADAWRYDPVEVRDSFTPFLIAVSNNTEQDIVISENSIFMYDENNVQYGVVPADAVDRSAMPNYVYPPSVMWGGGYYGWNAWGFGWSPVYPYDQYGSDVVPMALRFGPITAGARAHGFVYLQKLSSTSVQVKIVITPLTVTGKSLSFTFPFMIER
jgi:hypothetical protein